MILDDHLLPINTMFVWMLFFELLNLDPKLFGSKLQVGPNGPGDDVNAYLISEVLKLMASVD